MKLKGLEVQGFKTFPDKTKLDFTSGITAVVGPNGSGKSNISDAIRWVLGEQSAKSLRCSKMEDVIFNGTQQRKRTGYAQVTLSIDNTDRTLPYDGDEVAVTRRFYRSGNSEYLINHTNVRLQDIHELFMDTGLGRDGYSMIGQGKIDSIVSTKGEDRREIFEEAAGISRFRYKKAEAERRLERTEDNLVRLRDIMTELEGRVEPLRIQSEKAKAYLTYAEEKRGLEIAIWLKTLDKSALQIREQEDKLSVAKGQYDEAETVLAEVQQETERIFQTQTECSARADEIRRQITAANEESAGKKARISVLQNDILHNAHSVERLRTEIRQYQQSEEGFRQEMHRKEALLKELEQKLQTKREELDKTVQTLASLRSDEDRSGERLEAMNEKIAGLNRQASECKLQYMTSSATIDSLSGRTETVENTIRAKTSQIDTLQQIIADYEEMIRDCSRSYAEKSKAVAQKEGEAAESRQTWENQKSKADRLALESDRLFGKAKILEDLERNLEGFTQSVKLVMKEAKKGTLSGIHGPVSRVIRTPKEYSVAIEIALGAAMQNIVTENEQDAKRAIAFLKQHDGGRATFLPMSVIKGKQLSENGLESCRGFVGIASQLCQCDDCYRQILTNLLGRIVVASDLDCATEMAGKYGYRFRIVTLDGQVVNAGGSLTGGSLSKNTGLLGRAAEIETIRSLARQRGKEAEQARERWKAIGEALSAELQTIEGMRRELAEINENKIKITAECKSRTAEQEAACQACQDVRTERETIVRQLTEATDAMNQARSRYEALTEEIRKNEELIQVLSGSRNESVRKREALNETIQEARIAVLTLEKDMTAAGNGLEDAKARLADAADAIRRSREEEESLQTNNEGIRGEIETLEAEDRSLAQRSEVLGREIESLNRQRMALEKRSAELRQSERDKTSERERLSGELARLEERRANLQKQYDEIVSKLWEEYELTKREAETVAVPIEEPGKAQRRLSELKQKIKALGSVNVSAIEEYKEVSERYQFLKVQIGDVEKSKSELLRLINDLTKQMQEIFVERFRQINEHFSATFVELFGGGKASLSLSDPEHVLTTGIDISVEPPGKIVSHIELLSGGEKALVAIALYFSIMKVRPSPFCVMDEIEAALDDVNVYRFASYLRRMNANTQFICITHRRGTMEEADVLYGVTMQDRGISKLLELHVGEVEQKLGMKA